MDELRYHSQFKSTLRRNFECYGPDTSQVRRPPGGFAQERHKREEKDGDSLGRQCAGR